MNFQQPRIQYSCRDLDLDLNLDPLFSVLLTTGLVRTNSGGFGDLDKYPALDLNLVLHYPGGFGF
jgi:hypothetical protein